MEQESKTQSQDKVEVAFQSLLRIFGLLRQVMEPYFTQFGISGPQWGVLRTLHRAEAEGHNGLRSTDLGKRLLIRPPSVTGVIDRLARMGLVDRRDTSEDRRVRTIHLTGRGRDLVNRVLESFSGKVHELFSCLNSEQCDRFQELLNQLKSHMTELAKPDEEVF